METTQKQIVLGILAHVDSGKTTLSEAMLYRAGAIRKLGRVDHGDAFLDTDSLEKARGITIFSKQIQVIRCDKIFSSRIFIWFRINLFYHSGFFIICHNLMHSICFY